jgi:hypothetical protein
MNTASYARQLESSSPILSEPQSRDVKIRHTEMILWMGFGPEAIICVVAFLWRIEPDGY